MNELPENLKQQTHQFSCIICKKIYTRKSSLDKHKILCDFKMKTKREKQIEKEEQEDIPNHLELVKIVQELTMKMIQMEEKMAEMQKWVDKKKKKLNVVSWLNINITPTIGFLEWINTHFVVNAEHFEDLMENSLFHTIQRVFEHNLDLSSDFVHPIRCFTQKASVFYIGEKKEDNSSEWRQLELTDMILILKTFQNRMIKELTKWKKENENKFNDSDKIADLYQKAIIKLMSISFSQDANMSRIRNNLFHYLKTDLKMQIDYEFEF
jgi:hypothetical protein